MSCEQWETNEELAGIWEESKDRHTVRREKNELLGRALFCNVIHAGWCTLALPPHPLSIRGHLVEP